MLQSRLDQFHYWIRERENIRLNKEAGFKRPWTQDSVLHTYHFCNVRREDDRGTKEIREVVRKYCMGVDSLPYVYTLARLLNNAASLDVLLMEGTKGWGTLKDMMANGLPVFHTAYVVSTCGAKMNKLDYVRRVVEEVYNIGVPRTSCRSAYGTLVEISGLGSFLAGQVVADLKNDRYLEHVNDWYSFSVIGPGSRKGLSILCGYQIHPEEYDRLIVALDRGLPPDIKAMQLHRQDLQNCLCEFSKYIRLLDNLPGRRRPYHVSDKYAQCEFGIPTLDTGDAGATGSANPERSSESARNPLFD